MGCVFWRLTRRASCLMLLPGGTFGRSGSRFMGCVFGKGERGSRFILVCERFFFWIRERGGTLLIFCSVQGGKGV